MDKETKEYIDNLFKEWKADAAMFSTTNFQSILRMEKEEISNAKIQAAMEVENLKGYLRDLKYESGLSKTQLDAARMIRSLRNILGHCKGCTCACDPYDDD